MREVSCTVGKTVIHVDGLFLYRDMHGDSAAETFLKEFLCGMASFDNLAGAYLVEIERPDSSRIYFSDNSGMRRYYIHRTEGRFEPTFLAAMPKDKRNPDYRAIAQFLHFGCVYNSDTIESHVVLSNPESYYEVSEGKIAEKSKHLIPMDELEMDELVMEKTMHDVCKVFSNYKNFYCTITGGTDSRAVLSHLLYNHLRPNLNITGSLAHVDVVIAKIIAEATGLNLLVVPDSPEEGWLSEAITAAGMGMTEVCGSYRLYKKAKKLKAYGEVVECGGLAGEMYKNSFINQDFPFYCGTPNWNRFIKYKVMYFDFPLIICGEKIRKEISDMGKTLREWLTKFEKKSKAASYLAAGYAILQQRSAGIAAINAHHYIFYSPLIERKIAAYGFCKSPYALEMQAFQRHQVSRYWAALKDIGTDRGLSCNDEKMISEWMKSTAFLFKVWLKRFSRREKEDGRIDSCFQEGLHSPQYRKAFERCKEMGIISAYTNIEDVPDSIADRIFLVGSVL